MTTRLIVKNLPKHITQERFKEHFEQKGIVTDVKLCRTKDGVFRRFGFIGYKHEKDAIEAQHYFHKTFIDTSKIDVQFAKAIGDENIPRPWSKYSKGSSAHEQTITGQTEKDKQMEQEREAKMAELNAKAMEDAEMKKKFLVDLYGDDNDLKLKEFMAVMKPRSTTKTWANDEAASTNTDPAIVGADSKLNGGGAVKNSKSKTEVSKMNVTAQNLEDEMYEDLPVENQNLNDLEEDVEFDENLGGDVPKDSVAHNEAISDMDYFRSKMVNFTELSDNEDIFDNDIEHGNVDVNESREAQDVNRLNQNMNNQSSSNNENRFNNTTPSNDIHSQNEFRDTKSQEDVVAETGRLFIKNLAYSCTVEELEDLFKQFGQLAEAHISIDRETKHSKGYGFVQFLFPINAVKAYQALNGQIFQGRLMDILPGQEKVNDEPEVDLSSLSFKEKRERERKANAKKDFNWNSLFMNSDTVASAMAAKLNVKKSDILNPEADNMAVRLALAETNIINETIKYLEEEGISISAFESQKKQSGRSKSVILVKNIAYNTDLVELVQLFSKFGTLGRLVLPPTKTLAVVEFLEESEAKSAFRHLAYSRFKTLPLYLEWAPVNTFVKAFDRDDYEERKKQRAVRIPDTEKDSETSVKSENILIPDVNTKSGDSNGQNKKQTDVEKIADEENTNVSYGTTCALFVKNLNFHTTEAKLKAVFEALNGFRSARVSTKPDKKRPGERLSMGFGFVEFDSKINAKEAMKTMQDFVLDGHALQLKVSTGLGKTDSNDASSKDTKNKRKKNVSEMNDPNALLSSKLIIRNVPFEATKKEIRQLFTPFGQVKAVRIPRKMDGQHRGFAFIDFLTKQEAKAAFESLSSTHLYGRHLVLEWAKEEESIDAVRMKSKRQMLQVEATNVNKRLKALGENDFDNMDQDEY